MSTRVKPGAKNRPKQGVEVVDGLVSSDDAGRATRAAELRQAFAKDGYVVLRGLLRPEVVLELEQEILAILGGGSPYGHTLQSAFQADGREKLHKISNLMFEHPAFEALSRSDVLVDEVENLMGAGARRFRDVTIVRPASTEAAISWHQDSAYWDVEPPALISAWVPLVDVPPASSCLQIVPGTHRTPIEHRLRFGTRYLPKVASRLLRRAVSLAGTGDARGRTGGSTVLWDLKRLLLSSATRQIPNLYGLQDYHIPTDVVETLGTPVELSARRGDVVLFHSLVVHASGANRLSTPRITNIISYAPATARFVGRGKAELPLARAGGV